MAEALEQIQYVIADDFTGANDVGVSFAASGITTSVVLGDLSSIPPCSNQNGIQVICSDSRDISDSDAIHHIRHILSSLDLIRQQKVLIKKIDSTLRGNVGAEIEACLSQGYQLAIVAIAAPGARRRTENGLCYVHDDLLTDTEFATDPKSPIRSSRIKEIIETQTTLQVCEHLEKRRNQFHTMGDLRQLYDLDNKIIVCDAESLADLQQLYSAAQELPFSVVFVTTGEIGQALTCKGQQAKTLPTTQKPLLAVIGSMSKATLEQSDYLVKQCDATELCLSLNSVLSAQNESYLEHIAHAAVASIGAGKHTVIRSCADNQLRHQLPELALSFNLSQKEIAERVRDFLATVCRLTLSYLNSPTQVGGLLLCGGDIAIATANMLNAPNYVLGGMVAGCVPWGHLRSDLTPFPVFTKAGGFGDKTTFLQLIQNMKQEVN